MKFVVSMFFLVLPMMVDAAPSDPMPGYRETLQHELDNRAVARHVVPVMASMYKGRPAGEFWEAYQALENAQAPLYGEYGQCHGLVASGFVPWIKAKTSIVFAWLMPGRFVSLLSGATQRYLAELEQVLVPGQERDRAFWRYVVAQERAQVLALALAADDKHAEAAQILKGFRDSVLPVAMKHGACEEDPSS